MTASRVWPRTSKRSKRLGILLLVMATGGTALVRWDIAQRREALFTEARTAHRLLSQATSRVDAVLVTLVLTATSGNTDTAALNAASRLPAVYPNVLEAWRSDNSLTWTNAALRPSLEAAEARSRGVPASSRHAVIASIEPSAAQYIVVLAGDPASFALRVDARRLVAAEEWPWPPGSPVRATLSLGDEAIELQSPPPSDRLPLGLTQGFESTKVLASPSQPFVLHVQRRTGPSEWPWAALAAWFIVCSALYWAGTRWMDDRAARRRAADQVRLARASRLNAMGELAAGIAHELNQPLSALLATTQTALRIARACTTSEGLRVDEDDTSTIVSALELAGDQARRASAVIARLRKRLQPGDAATEFLGVNVADVARKLVRLMSDDLSAATVEVTVTSDGSEARADPVAVEQILHNLLTNAMNALGTVTDRGRSVAIEVMRRGDRVRCVVKDTGHGIPESVVPRLFEPFVTTRADGLGLGLPLCQTLAVAMDGQVSLVNNTAEGAALELDLPVATTARMDP